MSITPPDSSSHPRRAGAGRPELPRLLADPPWRRKAGAGSPVVLQLDALSVAAPPGVPVQMAERMVGMRAARAVGLAWLEQHPEAAAHVLVPRAVGPAGAARREAENLLLTFVAAGHGSLVATAAKRFGPEASAAIEALTAADPLDVLPPELPAMPRWVDPGSLPPVRLRGRDTVLPVDAVRDLVMVFALGQPGKPYPGVDVVRAACEPSDLARFAGGLFDAWSAAGLPGKHSWVLDALGSVGDDDTVRRLTPLIMAWPGQSGHARADAGVRALAAIGSDVALLHLDRIAERSKYRALKAAAQSTISEVAAARGLSAEQLADRLVPDFGLPADGRLTLDYGPRQFTVTFDEELAPCVTDAAGKRLTSLPRPGARDDAALAGAARQRFTTLTKDLRPVAADQVRRLERAMVTGRRWSPAEFTRFFVVHPLVRHLARRLLWGRYAADGAPLGAMRIAEDGTLADVHDETVTPADGELVGVAHPVHVADLGAWAESFADYRIVQPFPQLGRETSTLTAEEAASRWLTRVRGRTVPAGAVLGLERHGWRREAPQGGGVQASISVWPADDVEIVLDLDPGIVVGAPDVFPEQRLGAVSLRGRARTFGELGPVVIAELLRDLDRLIP